MNTFKITILVIILTAFSCCRVTNKKQIIDSNQFKISADTSFSFDKFSQANWQIALTGKGKMCSWEILNDANNNVIAQVSNEKNNYRFNIIVNKTLYYKDLEISVKLKGISGNNDQGGGLVWRYIDEDNYYVARANPLENNYTVYKVKNGIRQEFKTVTVGIGTEQWCNLRIKMHGNIIQCYFNDKLEMEVNDKTFINAGKIGLWTKSDAVSYFDDLKVSSLK